LVNQSINQSECLSDLKGIGKGRYSSSCG